MGSFKEITYRYRCRRQVEAIQLYAHWLGLTFDAAAKSWCENGCAQFWAENN